jgi:formylmethanofuran dehydrogenase subunit D
MNLPLTPNGNIVLDTCHIHKRIGQGKTISDGGFSPEYDTKRATIDPTDNDVVLIHDDGDDIDVNGLYGIVSYTL